MSLLLGKELGIAPIKTQAKDGSENLKALHCEINNILYNYTFQYIYQDLALELYQKLCRLGGNLKDLKVPDKAKAKKDEILTALRTICRSLSGYSNEVQTGDDAPLMQKSINGLVHQFIKEKNDSRRTPAGDSRLTPEEWLTFLVRTRKLYDYTNGHHHLLKLDTLRKVNAECLEAISSCGKI